MYNRRQSFRTESVEIAGLKIHQVCVDAGVSGSPGQVLVLPVGNVLPGPVIAILLGQSEVDEEELVAVAADAHQEVVWFDVAVDEVLVVHVLDATDHLKTKRRLIS